MKNKNNNNFYVNWLIQHELEHYCNHATTLNSKMLGSFRFHILNTVSVFYGKRELYEQYNAAPHLVEQKCSFKYKQLGKKK